MATAEESYCDSSALRALYLHDPRTRAMVAWLQKALPDSAKR